MAEGRDHPLDVTRSAPVGSVDLRAFDDDGNSYEITACHDGYSWHAEVAVVEGEIFVREWDTVDCSQFHRLIQD
ncbi:hypothetical protein ABZ916_09470 [Streptomyces sp. NPDC046853]|uniref:hypothetical protein n=1 Tax=Streptomyces sp. NPDC046853 TaxID=3154920 RepID=UPI003400AF32